METETTTVTEVPSDDFTLGDWTFIGGMALILCLVVGFILKSIKKTFKNVHLKVGDKIEVGVETKEGEK